MSDAKRTKNYIVHKLRKSYREGKLDTSQIARLKAIGFNFDGAVFNASKDSLAVQYPAIAEEWDKERNGEQTPWKVRPLATEKAWWRCPHCDRPYRLAIRSKVISNSGCPYCGYGGERAQVSLPVIRLDTLKSYPSIANAQREIGYSLKTAIDKSKLDRNGIAWCYLIDYELGRIPDFTKGNQVTPVICLETGKRFETQSQAEIELGISRGGICRALNTGKTAKGYHWIRESEYSEEKAAAARAESAPYRVVCLETGTRYKTYADAGRDLGVEEGNIQQAVKSKSHYARGYHFVNSDEYSTLAKGEIENILKWDGRSRTVVCVETGKRYESIKAAVAEYGDRPESARSGIGLWNHGALTRSSRGGACTLPTRTTTAMPSPWRSSMQTSERRGWKLRSRRMWRNPSMRKEAQPLRRRGISSGKRRWERKRRRGTLRKSEASTGSTARRYAVWRAWKSWISPS